MVECWRLVIKVSIKEALVSKEPELSCSAEAMKGFIWNAISWVLLIGDVIKS